MGKGDSATLLPQMDQNEGQTASTAGSWEYLLANQYKELHSLISSFLNEGGTSNPVELINELMLGNMYSSIGFDPESPYEPSKQYPICQADLARLFSATRLTQFLVKLGETWQRIERLEMATSE